MVYKKKMNLQALPLTKKQKAQVHAMVRKDHETKYVSFNPNNSLFSAGNVYTLNPLQSITTGNTSSTRVGDEINLTSIRYNAIIKNSGDSAANVRVLVTKSSDQVNTVSQQFTNGLFSSSTLLLQNAGSWMAPVDLQRHKVVHESYIKIPQNAITGQSNDRRLALRVPFKYGKFQFRKASTEGKDGNIYIHLIPIDNNIQFEEGSITTFYKDA